MTMRSISWDWNGGPDVDQLITALTDLGLHAVQVDDGGADFIVVASTEPIDADQALAAYENNQT